MSRLTKQELTKSYDTIMQDMRQELSPFNRLFSRTMHTGVIRHLGLIINISLLRPRPLLFAACGALITQLITLLAIYTYAYQPAGNELISGLIIGWLVGWLYEIVQFVITKIK